MSTSGVINNLISNTLLLLLIFGFLIPVSGQDSLRVNPDTVCGEKDLRDVVRSAFKNPPKTKPASEGSLLLVPIVGTNPATGFIYGVSGFYAFRMPGSNRYSTLMGTAQGTSKNQLIFILRNTIYTRGNRFFLTGDWRFLKYSQSTYGLGTTAPEGGSPDYQFSLYGTETSSDPLAQPMKFNFSRIHQAMSTRVAEGLYLGIGYAFDGYFSIVDEKLSLEPGDTLITSHYSYNTQYSFSTEEYFSSAINLNITYDTRDNLIDPHRGIYASAGWRGGFKFLGNTKPANFYQMEWRSYHGLSVKNPGHLIALWALGSFTPTGQFPYLILPALAYDQNGRSGRGYTQGRFRGPSLMYSEAEYRFPISRNGLFSGVLFLNATTTNNPGIDLYLFESIKAGYGAGLRIRADKKSRTNLTFDLGFGQKSFGLYISAAETF